MLFFVKTYKSNCYIAQLFSDQSTIVQLDVVVWSENCGIRQITMIQRENLCGMYKFSRWLLCKEKNVET